jgi:hypothetical protein
VTTPSTSGTADLFELRHAATDHATIVRVPERRMLALDGVGAPEGPAFRGAAESLHAVAEQLRADLHVRRHVETRVGAIESAWWVHPEPPVAEVPTLFADRRMWHWQMMVEVPRQATDDDVAEALAAAARAGVRDVDLVRIIQFAEGMSAQILHVGGSADAAEAVHRLYVEVALAGLQPRGHLHEIYLSDVRSAPAGRRRTILRLPIQPPATPER